jgi:integrase
MRKNLTAKLLDSLKPRVDRRYEVRDASMPGFGVRVAVTGTKSFFVMGRVNDWQTRHTIGTYPIISLAEAREVAREVLRDMQLGTYGKNEPKHNPLTLGDVMTDFIEIYAKPKNRTWKAQAATLRKFSGLSARPIAEITRSEIVKILDQVVANGAPIGANHAMAVIKKLFSWALDRGVLAVHPIIGMKAPAKARSRDRVLTDDEIKGFWQATADMGFPFGPAYRLMLLTGQRRGEVTGMKWSQIDLSRALWTIPAEMAKNGRAHEVPLSPPALDIIKTLPRFVGSDYVFTTTGVTPISGFGRSKDRLDLAMGTSDWWTHDLRRTAASGMARIGVAPHVIEKVLNHVSGQISGVAAVYNRHGYQAEKRDALERWAEEIARVAREDNSNHAESIARTICSPVRHVVSKRTQSVA